jgi:hypothetical protein
MTFTHALSTNNYGTAKFIVDASAANGTHTNISAALTSASSGDTIFIRPGTYTEDLTLKAGVNLVAYTADAYRPNVTIVGKLTATFAGSCALSGLYLQTNSDFCLAITGNSATVVTLTNCQLYATNNTAISFTSSSSSAVLNLNYCNIAVTTTGISSFSNSSAGTINAIECFFSNTGGSSTAISTSAGVFNAKRCDFDIPISVTSTGNIRLVYCQVDTSATNSTAVTLNNVGITTQFTYSKFASGTASAITITAGALQLLNSIVESSNANAITGAGTLFTSNVLYLSSGTINPTTLQLAPQGVTGTFTPVLQFGGGTTGITYTTQIGKYWATGPVVHFAINITLSNKGSSTGNATIIGLPFASSNDGFKQWVGAESFITSYPTGTNYVGGEIAANGSTIALASCGPGNQSALTNSNFSNTSQIAISGFYWT